MEWKIPGSSIECLSVGSDKETGYSIPSYKVRKENPYKKTNVSCNIKPNDESSHREWNKID
jgi:hypothetical protein